MIKNYQELADKFDIIIPTYNSPEKLKKTIFSYGLETCFHFIVIADGDGLDYEPIKEFFKGIQDITVYNLPNNVGPGNARNYGLDKATRDYVTFIDTGDTLYNPTTYLNVLERIINEPQFLMISCAHLEMRDDGNLRSIGPEHNRMHGKFFKRSFLEEYKIRFDPETSRMNEDIGFNFIARAIAGYIAEQTQVSCILHLTDGIIIWECDEDSITRENNYAFYYQKNNEGLARNTIYAIKHLQKYNISMNFINDIIYQTIPSLYVFYYSCVFCRPEFEEEMRKGAIKFFTFLKDNKLNIESNLLTAYYNKLLKGIYSSDWDPFTVGIPDMTILQWIDKLLNIE